MVHVASLRPRPAASSLPRAVRGARAALPGPSLPSPWRHRGAASAADGNVLTGCHAAQCRGLSLLQHRHLGQRGGGPAGIVSYDAAHKVQERHRTLFLSWKTSPDSPSRESESPRPLVISFESTPTYTIGRRQHDLTSDQAAHLGQKLDVSLAHRQEPILQSYYPDVRRTKRGGLTTYHGPGQLVFWPVVDMHSPLHTKFSVPSYASHLEATTQRLLAELFGIKTSIVDDEPGVWVEASGHRPRKIAALGVHHRRHITSLGIAVNVDVAVTGGEDVNPWSRFVPCGLQDKDVTSVAAEMRNAPSGSWDMAKLAQRWASIFEEGLLNGKRGGTGGGADARL